MTVKKPSIKHLFTIDWNTKRWGKGKMAPAPEYVVIHFTGSGGKGGSAVGVYKDWLTREKKTRCNSHYIVDATGIYEGVDPKKYGCLAATGSKPSDEHIAFYPGSKLACSHLKVAGNYNTINIETCSAKHSPVSRRRDAYMDTDFYFPDKTYKNLVALVSWLLDEFSIPMPNLIMHHQITGKLCPAMWCNNDGAFAGWTAFRNDVAQVLNKSPTVDDLPAPTGDNTENDGHSGTINVKRGTPYYMDADGVIMLGYIDADRTLNYTAVKGDMYYTTEGYVRQG